MFRKTLCRLFKLCRTQKKNMEDEKCSELVLSSRLSLPSSYLLSHDDSWYYSVLSNRLNGCADTIFLSDVLTILRFCEKSPTVKFMPTMKWDASKNRVECKKITTENENVENPQLSNDHLERIYKLQIWQNQKYSDELLRSLLDPEMVAHMYHYKHLYTFPSINKITFNVEELVLLELAKAAIYICETLRSLSKFSPCLPVHLIFIILNGYKDAKLIRSIAPDIFFLDIIHLFPELFPFCSSHPKCKDKCISYHGVRQDQRNAEVKLIGSLLSFSSMHKVQVEIILKQCFPEAIPMMEFLNISKFLIDVKGDELSLSRERLDEYLTLGTSDPYPLPGNDYEESSSDEDDRFPSQGKILRREATKVFSTNHTDVFDFQTLYDMVAEEYEKISEITVTKMDFRHELEKGLFVFDNDQVKYLG